MSYIPTITTIELKRIVKTNLIRVSYRCMYKPLLIHFKIPFKQVTRPNALIIKVDVVCVGLHILRRLIEELSFIIIKLW